MKVNDLASHLRGLGCFYQLRPQMVIIGKSELGKMNYQNYIDSPGRGLRSRTFPKVALPNSTDS